MPRYVISIHNETNLSFKDVMLYLFSRGFVFSSSRHKTIDDIKEEYPHCLNWSYISIGTDLECRMVEHGAGMIGNNRRYIVPFNTLPTLLIDY
jgi:hypothetical protein